MKVIVVFVSAVILRVVTGTGRNLHIAKLEVQDSVDRARHEPELWKDTMKLLSGQSSGGVQAPGPAPAPGPVFAVAAAAPAPGPLPGLEAVHITFEIKNFNYFDLTKETCPRKVKVPKKKPAAPKPEDKKPEGPFDPLQRALDKHLGTVKSEDFEKDQNVSKAVDEVHGQSDHISKTVESGIGLDGFGDLFPAAGKAEKPPWMQDKKKKEGANLLQLEACAPMPDLTETKNPNKCSTVMDVLRKAIQQTVLGVIRCLYLKSLQNPMAPGPAPSPAGLPTGSLPAAPAGVSGLVPLPPQPGGGAFLAPGPAPGAPAPAPQAGGPPPMPDVKVFVTFSPGREMEGGRSTLVEIAFIDTPQNGVDDMMTAMPLLHQSIESGLFKTQIKQALHAVTGIKPKIHGIKLTTKVIEQWHVDKCEEHIKFIVKQFSLHYTRNQVPMALYNECTNFMTRMSFSHDYILDPLDTARCRKATAKFAKHWDFGENAQDSDFADMCLNACEAKYGRGAPRCNIHAGDGLLNQPL